MLSQKSETYTTVSRQRQEHQATGVRQGTRFMKAGHWWEVDYQISGKAGPYYKCHPVCNIETRFFTGPEISQSIQQDQQKLDRRLDASDGRGSGRVTGSVAKLTPASQGAAQVIDMKTRQLKHQQPTQAKAVEPCKLLAIGSRHSVQKTIQDLHGLGFAHTTDWSPVQRNPRSGECISIFTGRKS